MAMRAEQDQQMRRNLVRMSCLVVDNFMAVSKAIEAQDASIAREAIRSDEKIDEQRNLLDDRFIAALFAPSKGELFAPAKSEAELREAVVGLQITLEIERAGDCAVSIAKAVLKLVPENRFLHPSLRAMSDICIDMLRGAIDAYLTRDINLARVTSKRDDETDALCSEILQMMSHKSSYSPDECVQNALIAKAYERMGDHVTNICEWVVYEKTGLREKLN